VSWPSRALGTAIAAVFTVAVAAVAVETTASPSGASPPPPGAVDTASLPATVQSPEPQPAAPQASPRAPVPTASGATYLSTSWGVDVSWPQCDPGGLPSVSPGFAIVGLTGGRPFTSNPCLDREAAYARNHTGYSAYLNVDAPRSGTAAAYGHRVALDGLARLARAHLSAPTIWLDVEILNHWADPATNVAVINATLQTIQKTGASVGIYSSAPMWQQITGGAHVGVPVWLATSITDYHQLAAYCLQGLGGQPALMTQYVATDGHRLVDIDVLCAKGLPGSVRMFAAGKR
jgi:hypothetical protein